MEEKNLIGIRIRQAREESGLTQVQLAERIGVAFQSLQQWESGKTTPRPERIRKLANVLGKSPTWIQFGIGSETLGTPEDFISYLKTDEFKTQFCSAYAAAMKQCINLNWIGLKRPDISIQVLADICYSKFLEEFGSAVPLTPMEEDAKKEA